MRIFNDSKNVLVYKVVHHDCPVHPTGANALGFTNFKAVGYLV
jgi:hypothetical protein